MPQLLQSNRDKDGRALVFTLAEMMNTSGNVGHTIIKMSAISAKAELEGTQQSLIDAVDSI